MFSFLDYSCPVAGSIQVSISIGAGCGCCDWSVCAAGPEGTCPLLCAHATTATTAATSLEGISIFL